VVYDTLLTGRSVECIDVSPHRPFHSAATTVGVGPTALMSFFLSPRHRARTLTWKKSHTSKTRAYGNTRLQGSKTGRKVLIIDTGVTGWAGSLRSSNGRGCKLQVHI